MKIGIFGMGYVGAASAACLLEQGHSVVGVDVDQVKVNMLSQGKSPMIQEKGLEELLYNGHQDNRLKATINPEHGIIGCDMVWVCVGTPSNYDGSINLSYIKAVIKSIGHLLVKLDDRPLIVMRSTCLPGTMEKVVIPLLEESSGLEVPKEVNIVFHPEFMREGTAVEDFKNPPKIVVGQASEDPDWGNRLIFDEIYKGYDAPQWVLTYGMAEMIKYCDNIFHAVKITFANEVAKVAHSVGVESRIVADVFCSDTKLNISSTYLRPGFAYGGSCLPKDLKAILRFAELNNLQLPMLKGIVESNSKQIDDLINRVLSFKPEVIGMVGIAFKQGTDDMRESPYVSVAKALIGEGVEVKIYDPFVHKECLIGSNKEKFYNSFKNVDNLLVTSLEELDKTDLIIINHNIVGLEEVNHWTRKGIYVVDTVDINEAIMENRDKYIGIYW